MQQTKWSEIKASVDRKEEKKGKKKSVSITLRKCK